MKAPSGLLQQRSYGRSASPGNREILLSFARPMPLDEIRYHFKVTLADLARGVEAQGQIVPLHHRDETLERFYLRVLTWALFWTPDLQIAPPTTETRFVGTKGLPDVTSKIPRVDSP